MAFTDMSLEELRAYRPEVAEPEDFDEFWNRTLTAARASAVDPVLAPAQSPVTELKVEDLTFSGFDGDPIRAWVIRPHREGALPTVIEFVGYNGGRGIPGERLHWAASGYVHVLVDTRGQGSGWGNGGDTPDPHGSDGAVPGFMTRGILDPEKYFYRRAFTDAVRAVDVAAQLPFVDAERITVRGGSQGGGMALAAAALHPDVHSVLADVPFLCHFARSVRQTPQLPFREIERYLSVHRDRVEQVFENLSYFDCVNFARRITTPAYFSVALMDDVVLPSSVFAAYNHCGSRDASIEVYEFNGHEAGDFSHWLKQMSWLADHTR